MFNIFLLLHSLYAQNNKAGTISLRETTTWCVLLCVFSISLPYYDCTVPTYTVIYIIKRLLIAAQREHLNFSSASCFF
jgi:hypothetical protein